MNEIITTIFIINFSIVYIWDYTGFIFELFDNLVRLLSKGKITKITLKKPLGCSLCMVTWTTFFYLLLVSNVTFPIVVFISLLSGFLSKYVFFIIQTVDMLLERFILILQSIINYRK